MPKPLPKHRVEKVESLILGLLQDAKKRVGPKGGIPVCDPDYAEAYGVHRGFLIAMYGEFYQLLPIVLPDGSLTNAQDWFRSLRGRVDP